MSVCCGLKKIRDNSFLVIQPFFYNLYNSNPAAQRWCRRTKVKITVDSN